MTDAGLRVFLHPDLPRLEAAMRADRAQRHREAAQRYRDQASLALAEAAHHEREAARIEAGL